MFPDIVIGEDEQAGNFSALLTVNQNTHTKILRREVSSCPIQALRRMVQRIQKDTAVLLSSSLRILVLILDANLNNRQIHSRLSSQRTTRLYGQGNGQVRTIALSKG